MDKSIPPLMCNTPPPMDDGFEDDDDEEEVSVGSIEDSSTPSTPSKNKSLDNDLPVPEELPALAHITPETPQPAKIIIPPPDEILIKSPVISDSIPIITSLFTNEPTAPQDLQPSPPAPNEFDVEQRSESPPSLELLDPVSTDLSFDDPNLDDIPEDDFYTNTDLSLPSLRLDLNADSLPEQINPPNILTDTSPDQPTEDDFSTASKDLTEDDMILPTIEATTLELPETPPLDEHELHSQSVSSAEEQSDSFPHPVVEADDFHASFDEFVEFTESFETIEVVTTDVNSNQTIKDSTISLAPASNEFGDSQTPQSIENSDKNPEDVSSETNEANDISFDVDFSQFNAFESAPPLNVLQPPVANNTFDDNDDDDDDFGDFNDAPLEIPSDKINTILPQPNVNAAVDDEEDDDDFGDFSTHFQTTQPSITAIPTNVKDVCDKCDSLLAMMFPISNRESEKEADHESSVDTSNESKDLLSDITLAVRNVDDSKALQHQWLTSTTKGSLVLALGIDSRNILYGNKWNSSMPRFAANLGFTPLEPTKSTADGSAPGGVRTTSDVPAAQFDWTSSGLVNPLDDQLVVVSANVDNLTIASSAAYSDSVVAHHHHHRSRRQSSASSSCSSTTPVRSPPPPPHFFHSQSTSSSSIINQSLPHHTLLLPINATNSTATTLHSATNIPCDDGSAVRIDNAMDDDNTLRRGLFDHFLDSRVQEILHEANATQNRTTRSDIHWPLRSSQQPPEAAHIPSGPPATSQPTPMQSISSTTSIVHESLIHKIAPVDDAIPTPISSSYVVPGSGTLKETHIFTPSKVIVPFVSDDHAGTNGSESGVRIDENVVKKEYHDIEYNPKPASPNVTDEFSDFQSVKHEPELLQPIQSGNAINWPDPGRLTGVELESFDQFICDNSSKTENRITNHEDVAKEVSVLEIIGSQSISIGNEFGKETIPKPSIDFDMFSPNLDIAKPDLETSTKSSVLNDFLTLSPNQIQIPSSSSINSTESNGFDKDPRITKNDSFDDFTEFQCVPIPVHQPPQVSSTVNTFMTKPLEPASLLVPTTIQPSQPASQIAWPDPGIDSDEMARLEAIFPTPKTISLPNPVTPKNGSPKRQGTVDEVEWTDFVSSSAGFQPITHIINQNILKHQQEKPTAVVAPADDDDWSDFVSSGTSQFNSTTSGPNFPAWNAPTPSFGSWTPAPNSLKPEITQITNRMPTVSLIPDLGFVAPAPPAFIRGSTTTSSGRNGSLQSAPYGAPARK